MPLIPEDSIEQVRQSTDIVELISDHVQLTRRGRNFLGLCPFHDDHSPSFNVSQEKQIYKCFVCGAGGNAFKFLMEMERISFGEAVRKLAQRCGVELPESREDTRGRQEALDGLYRANELAVKYYSHLLINDARGEQARTYLDSRGLNRETLEAFSLGCAPDAWDGFLRVAGRRGVGPELLQEAGLAVPRSGGTGYYDRFRNRVMFPIASATGRTVAFGARALDAQEQAKYLNSPETPIYHKSATLYGLWRGRDTIRTEGVALVVEGYMDVIALAQSGIENAVASSGTALTPEHARLLRRYADRAVLVFDGDAAGTAAAVRGVESLFGVDLDVRVISLPQGEDPDSYVRTHGPEGFLELVQAAQTALHFLLAWVGRQHDLGTGDGKARAAATLAGFLVRVDDEVRRRFLIQEAAEGLGIDEGTIVQALKGAQRPRLVRRSEPEETEPAEAFDPRPRSEQELVVWMMSNPETADSVLSQVGTDAFTNSFYRRIAHLIAERRAHAQTVDPAVLIDACRDPALAGIISSLSMEADTVDPEQQAVPLQDYIHKFRLDSLDAQIDKLEAEMKTPTQGDELRPLLERHRELTAERKALAESR